MDIKFNQQSKEIEKAAEKYKNKSVLITGSSGFIGSSLARAFFGVDCRLRLLDVYNALDIPKEAIAKVEFIKGDITCQDVWNNSLKGIDYVFHLAALEYNRSDFNLDKDLAINALAVVKLLKTCCRNKNKPKIIFSSSANLFGLKNILSLNEESRTEPASLWSAHKLLAENYLKIYAAKYKINMVILRLANVYGPSFNNKAMGNVVVNRVITNALAGKDLYLYRNKQSLRDYLYIDDAVRAFLLAGSCKSPLPKHGYYVIGSQGGLSISQAWKMIATEIEKKTGKKIRIKFDRETKLEPFDYRNLTADSRLFSKATVWLPLTRLRSGIRSTIVSMLS